MPTTRLILCALCALLLWTAPASAARPNVVLIETDDQTLADLQSMPRTRALLGDRGTTFQTAVVSMSQCCPSRATTLTGRYARNHGVLTTQPPFGGFDAFADDESLAVWLQRAGYRTAFAGKYLNGYGRFDPTYIPPGWDDWRGLLGPTAYEYFGFAINDNGRPRSYPGEYQTDVLTTLAVDQIERAAAGDQPFFLWTAYVAPHVGTPHDLLDVVGRESAAPSPFFRDTFIGVPPPRTPAFNEGDVSDKPAAVRRMPGLGKLRKARLDESWRQAQEALQSVDVGVVRIVDALDRAGVLDDTLIVFTSDNGFMTGEHRLKQGKVVPYEPSIRVPLLLRGPGVPEGRREERLVWNGDLTATLVEATGARPAWPLDGEPLFSTRPRRGVLLEGPPRSRLDPRPTFTGVRTERWKYVEYMTGEQELYDLRADPDELENLRGRPAVRRRLARVLADLRRCEGRSCRD